VLQTAESSRAGDLQLVAVSLAQPALQQEQLAMPEFAAMH
jgi:hypothetical protein